MTDDENRLLDAGAAAADGAEPDVSQTAGGPLGALVDELRTIAVIARAHSVSTNSGSTDPDPASDLPAGTAWGSLVVRERIGGGRFGDVYRAFDPTLQREVALKILRGRNAASDGVVEEGRLAARVRHPNVVTIYGAQTIEGRSSLWMELVDGHTLDSELRRWGSLPGEEVAAIGRQLCLALAAVHGAGLVHRDVKASNVMRDTNGRIVLGDFGTGQELAECVANAGHLAGTPAYLAPEIFRGAGATPASDIYSLGALLFQLATGQYPVEGRTLTELRAAHLQVRPARLAVLRRRVSRELASAIERAIDPDPARRFGSAQLMERALRPLRLRGLLRAAAIAAGVALPLVLLGWPWAPDAGDPPVPPPARQSDINLPRPSPVTAPPLAVVTVAGEPPQPSGTTQLESEVVPVIELLPDVFQFPGLVRLRGSNDGKTGVCTTVGERRIALCDLATGQFTVLGLVPGAGQTGSGEAAISPDGQKIAYLWDYGDSIALRGINIDGTADRELFRPAHRNHALKRWDQTSSAVVVQLGEGGDASFVRVPLTGDAPRELARIPGAGEISPDGKWLATTRPRSPVDRDILLHEVATGQEFLIASNPADETRPYWMPDGDALVFFSTRNGELGLYVVDVQNGQASEPRLVTPLGRATVRPFAFARDGSLFLEIKRKWGDVVVADIDLAAGTMSPIVPVHTGSMFSTSGNAFAADGDRLAYVARSIGEGPPSANLIVKHMTSGRSEQRPLPADISGGKTLWLHDGRLAVSYHDGVRHVVGAFDVRTGRADHLLERDGVQGVFSDPYRPLLYYRVREPNHSKGQLYFYKYDLTTRTEQLLFGPDGGPESERQGKSGGFAVAQDGSIALLVHVNEAMSVRIIRPDGSTSDHGTLGGCTTLAWTADGRFVVAGCFTGFRRAGLAVLDVHSGQIKHIPAQTDLVGNISIRPDGRMISYSAGNTQPEYIRVRVKR